jgi:hypothetical protein
VTPELWLAGAFAGAMLATAGYCLTRLALSLRRRRPTDRPADGIHVLMGVAMAGMLVPRLRVVPTAGWEALFAAGAVLFLWRMARPRGAAAPRPRPAHDIQHLLGCGAMVYMLAVMTGHAVGVGPGAGLGTVPGNAAGAMSGGGEAVSSLGLVLAVALFGCVVWTADRISTLAPVAVGALSGFGVPLSPRLAASCEIAMGITMGYMLIVLH